MCSEAVWWCAALFLGNLYQCTPVFALLSTKTLFFFIHLSPRFPHFLREHKKNSPFSPIVPHFLKSAHFEDVVLATVRKRALLGLLQGL